MKTFAQTVFTSFDEIASPKQNKNYSRTNDEQTEAIKTLHNTYSRHYERNLILWGTFIHKRHVKQLACTMSSDLNMYKAYLAMLTKLWSLEFPQSWFSPNTWPHDDKISGHYSTRFMGIFWLHMIKRLSIFQVSS